MWKYILIYLCNCMCVLMVIIIIIIVIIKKNNLVIIIYFNYLLLFINISKSAVQYMKHFI